MFYFLNKNVRYLRNKNNLTQSKMADKLELKLQSYKNFEAGQVNTSLEVLDKLHLIFEISLDDLVYKDLSAEEKF